MSAEWSCFCPVQRDRRQHGEGERNRHRDGRENVPPDRRVGRGRQVSSVGQPPLVAIGSLHHRAPGRLGVQLSRAAAKHLLLPVADAAFLWFQPVVQRPESGPQLHRAGDPRDARRAGQPPERSGEWGKTLWEETYSTLPFKGLGSLTHLMNEWMLYFVDNVK